MVQLLMKDLAGSILKIRLIRWETQFPRGKAKPIKQRQSKRQALLGRIGSGRARAIILERGLLQKRDCWRRKVLPNLKLSELFELVLLISAA
jgi:hypothetical protein